MKQVAKPTPELGLNPQFMHPDDSTGSPSGAHCRWPQSEVECIWCVVSDNHKHTTTRLWKFNHATGRIHTEAITCTGHIWPSDGLARHDWLFGGGPAGSNANMVWQDEHLHGYTRDQGIVEDQRAAWLAVQVRKRQAEYERARLALLEARAAFEEA